MTVITRQQLINKTFEVIERDPDWRYRRPDDAENPSRYTCLYVHPNGPGCIFGQVLHELGVPLAELKAVEGSSISNILPKFISGVVYNDDRDELVGADYDLGQWLRDIQYGQDLGWPVGEALLESQKHNPQEVK